MIRLILLLVSASVLGWLVFATVVIFGLFETFPLLRLGLFTVGLAVTTVTLIVILATFILRIVLEGMLHIRPSDLVRAVVYSGLTFAGSLFLLSQFGFNVTSLLTTSAILGAIVGFSMQSTLGSLIAGVSISGDPLLKIGSALQFEGHMLTIEQKTWRHVVGRRLDNLRVLIPNSTLAEMALEVFPEDASARFDVFLHLPPDIPPQVITDLLSDGFSDMEHIDSNLPVMVAPVEMRPAEDSIIYRVRLWARSYVYIEDVLKGEVLRRCWYILDRAGIGQPRSCDFTSPQWPRTDASVLAEVLGHLVPSVEEALGRGDIKQYKFAPSELLKFPFSDAGKVMLIVEGAASFEKDIYLDPLEHGRRVHSYLPPLNVQELSKISSIRAIAHLLSESIGPVAENLVQEGMREARDPKQLLQKLAPNIADETQRERFVARARGLVQEKATMASGTRAKLIVDAAGRVIPDVELRAVSEVHVVTIPATTELLEKTD